MIQDSLSPSAQDQVPLKPLVALVAATIVHHYNPEWLSAPIRERAEETSVLPSRVSRVTGRVEEAFEAAIEEASRPGRPARPGEGTEAALTRRIALLEEELEVMKALHADHPVRTRTRQDALVAAQARLEKKHGVTQEEFCRALDVPERSFRSWKQRTRDAPAPPAPTGEATAPPRKRKKVRSRKGLGRFDLVQTLPGVQVMGDTTDVRILGVDLKLVATQDPGARHERPLESFALEGVENHEVVAEALRKAFQDLPGAQFVPDQGTPYMAYATKELCEELEVEHSPTKEGTPTEKATLERGFGVVKSALRPLLELTNQLAEAIPALKDPELARSLGRLLLATYLNVYVMASQERPASTGPLPSPALVEDLVEEQRERARADGRSVRLFLEKLREEYDFPIGKATFVKLYRRYHLDDLKEAEQRFQRRMEGGSEPVKKPLAYFAAILRNVAEQGKERRTIERQVRLANVEAARRVEERGLQLEALRAQERLLDENPEERILQGLDQLARQYLPETGTLFLDGAGFGKGALRRGLRLLLEDKGLSHDRAEAAWSRWLALQKRVSPDLVILLRGIFEDLLREVMLPAASEAHL